jgi:hypothetical protein
MWTVGPWTLRLVPLLWPVVGAALASWAALACWRASWERQRPEETPVRRAA